MKVGECGGEGRERGRPEADSVPSTEPNAGLNPTSLRS